MNSNPNGSVMTKLQHLLQKQIRGLELPGMLLRAIRQSGGISGVAGKVRRVYQQDGISGIAGALKQLRHSNMSLFRRNDYKRWISIYDTMTASQRTVLDFRLKEFEHTPLISILMPTYNSNPKWLVAAIESVRAQVYPHWELCIADDASTDTITRNVLTKYAESDNRIKVTFRERNGHISASSNSALALAKGDWVALLDHDDLLAEHALFWVVDAINNNNEVRLIYSDEDKVDDSGDRFQPYFKSDWNRDLFFSHNLVNHLGVYQRSVISCIGGFREGFEGSQDHDLVLRYIEQIREDQICHIPRVLYHWRIHAESTAQTAGAKPYAMLAGERALNEYFKRNGINASAHFEGHGYRIQYVLPPVLPLVSLIIPTRNGLSLIERCITSILTKTTYTNYEIIVVDNGSDDPDTLRYLDELRADRRVRVVTDSRDFNYSAINNKAVTLANGRIVGLLNNDLEVITPEWLSEMVSHALRPGVGAVGARLWYPNERLQHGGVIVGLGGVAGHAHKHLLRSSSGYMNRAALTQNFSAVTAACLVIDKRIYESVGGLNEGELAVAFNDVDFCLKVEEAGYRNVWTPYAELYHHESATRGRDDTEAKRLRFSSEVGYMRRRWGRRLMDDPAYSPNLTLDHEDFSLAWPPRVDRIEN